MFSSKFFGKRYFAGNYFPPPRDTTPTEDGQTGGGGASKRARRTAYPDTDGMMIELAIMLIVSGVLE